MGILPHRFDESPGHGTSRRPSNASIRARLIIRTPAKHPTILPLTPPVLLEMLLAKPLVVGRFVAVLETLEERRGSAKKHLRVLDLVRVETSTHKVCRRSDKANAFLHVVHEVDVAVRVRAVDKGELDSGAGVAAVEDDGHSAAGRDCGDEDSVELFRIVRIGLLRGEVRRVLTVSLVICPFCSKSKGQIVSSNLPFHQHNSSTGWFSQILTRSLYPHQDL